MKHQLHTQPQKQINGFTVVEIVLVIAIIGLVVILGVIGWNAWNKSHTSNSNTASTKSTTPASQSTEDSKQSADNEEIAKDPTAPENTPEFVDFRTNGYNTSGVLIATTNDVAKLTSSGAKLQAFFASHMSGTSYIVAQLYGNYAVGMQQTAMAPITLWGPTNSGEMGALVQWQEDPKCTELSSVKAPHDLDLICANANGSESQY